MRGSECEIVVNFCTDHITDNGLELSIASSGQ
jgi:hypothetical protein